MWSNATPKVLWRLACTALVVFACERIGPNTNLGYGEVAAVGLSSGVAMALLTLWGLKYWPGVLAGALWSSVHFGTGIPLGAGIALGDTVEALLGAYLLRRLWTDNELTRPRDALVLIGVAVGAPLMSILGLVGALGLLDVFPREQFVVMSVARWMGDTLGVLVMVPPLRGWMAALPPTHRPERAGELMAVVVTVSLGVTCIFLGQREWLEVGISHAPRSLFILPPLLWAALRLRPRGASTALAAMAMGATWFTLLGYGPFAHEVFLSSLLELQLMLLGMVSPILVLIAAVADREATAVQLRVAKAQADAANLAKSRFVAAVRHDLAQPLQAMRLFLGALGKQPLTAQGNVIVDRLTGGLEAMDATLATLKDITSVECDLVRPQISTFPIAALISQLAEEGKLQATQKGLSLRYVPCGSMVETDRNLLGRVLRNLLSNALRYTSAGKILIGCRHHPEGLRIEVWDTGPGIPAEQRELIFTEFYRAANPSSNSADGGLGLGLATVRRLSTLLGWEVSVRSVVGKGSVFALFVPLKRAERAAA